MISFAQHTAPAQNLNVSVSMGIFVNEEARKIVSFLDDPAIQRRLVNETCERCSLFDCKERMAAPVVLNKKHKHEELKKTIKVLLQQGS